MLINKSLWMKFVTPWSHCTQSLQAMCCGHCSYSWVSNVSEDAGQVAWCHLTFALLGVLLFCALPWDRTERIAPVCYNDHLCCLFPPCLGSGHSLGSHTHIHITLASLDATAQASNLYSFAHLRWCGRSWVMLSCARSPSESDLPQLCWLQGSHLPVLAVPRPVECSEAQAT